MKGHPTAGARIQKPRSAAQQAQAKRYTHQQGIAFPTRDAGLPTGSWWTTGQREGFTDTAAHEAARMKQSKFGQIRNVVTEE